MNTSLKSLLSTLLSLLIKVFFLIDKFNAKLKSASLRIPTLV
ncbi:hypothetical protein JOC76_006069 [Neobacillus cucumis]|nr:hypothetical protein [Neobacillus cucumis]